MVFSIILIILILIILILGLKLGNKIYSYIKTKVITRFKTKDNSNLKAKKTNIKNSKCVLNMSPSRGLVLASAVASNDQMTEGERAALNNMLRKTNGSDVNVHEADLVGLNDLALKASNSIDNIYNNKSIISSLLPKRGVIRISNIPDMDEPFGLRQVLYGEGFRTYHYRHFEITFRQMTKNYISHVKSFLKESLDDCSSVEKLIYDIQQLENHIKSYSPNFNPFLSPIVSDNISEVIMEINLIVSSSI